METPYCMVLVPDHPVFGHRQVMREIQRPDCKIWGQVHQTVHFKEDQEERFCWFKVFESYRDFWFNLNLHVFVLGPSPPSTNESVSKGFQYTIFT